MLPFHGLVVNISIAFRDIDLMRLPMREESFDTK